MSKAASRIARLLHRGGWSPLYRFFWENFAEFGPHQPGQRADYQKMTRELAALGLTNRDGTPLTTGTVKKTLQRVRVAKARLPNEPVQSTEREIPDARREPEFRPAAPAGTTTRSTSYKPATFQDTGRLIRKPSDETD